jgi:hypothetical protein
MVRGWCSMTSERDRLRQIEELRSEMHRRMGGRYDPGRLSQLVHISQELDKLVVEVTRDQLSRQGGERNGGESTRRRPKRTR